MTADPEDKCKNNTPPAMMPPPPILSAAVQASTTVDVSMPKGTPIGVAAKKKGAAPAATGCIVKQKAAAATKGGQPPLSPTSPTAAAQKVQNHHLQCSLGHGFSAVGLDEEDGEEAAPASPVVEAEVEADAQAGGAEEQAEEIGAGAGAPGLESKIVAIRDFLDDPNQPEDELVRLLQNLADMDVTYNALQATDIGRQVNGLRKHFSAEVRRLVKQLIRKWKEIVNDWVRLHNSGGDGSATAMTADGDSPDKIQGRSHQSPRVSAFQYFLSPQRQNGSASERANNGFESTMDAKRRASPVPAHHNSKQMNNNHDSTTTTTTSSAPAKVTREQRPSLWDLDKLDSARKRLQENYQEAQNAKKQRTIQVMDINDIPKPKTRNAFIRKSSNGGLPARNR